MKKLFSLVAAALMTMGVNAQGTYAVGADAPTDNEVVTSVSNITFTYGTGWNAGKSDKTLSSLGFNYYTQGSTNPKVEDGVPTSGAFYKFEPAKNGTVTAYIYLNADKAFFVTNGAEDAIFTLTDKDGKAATLTDRKSSEKLTGGIVKFDVKANNTYYVYCTGSKLGIYGFVYELAPTVDIPEIASETGFASFSSDKALDFTGVEGIEAYVISEVTESYATLTQVTKVPANTGLILKGTAGEAYTVDILDGEADTFTNKLEAATTATTVDANSVYVVNEGALHPFSGTEIPAGKAYLPASEIPSANGVRVLNLIFGEATGINAVQGSKADNAIYDLSGRRVEKLSKGIFVVNGKKIVVK